MGSSATLARAVPRTFGRSVKRIRARPDMSLALSRIGCIRPVAGVRRTVAAKVNRTGNKAERAQMSFELLTDDRFFQSFVDRHYHKLPYASAGTAASCCSLGTWDVLAQMVTEADADMLIAHDGVLYAGERPATPAAASALSAQGYTILVRHAERHDDNLRQLADAFCAAFHAPVDVHVYATPAGRHGFSWHYDAEDVFIVQTCGEKEYALRKNTVNPWPLQEALPHDMRYESEIMPLMRVVLRGGDWLYIPCGYWHKAEAPATGEVAISLAVGVMSPAAIAFYDFLRPQLLQSLIWRQRLPVTGSPADATLLASSDTADPLEPICEQLIDDSARLLRNSRVRAQFLTHLREGPNASSGR